MKKSMLVLTVVTFVLLTSGVGAKERVDTETNKRIRDEGASRSQVMRTIHYLTDVYGPRLTGSPNLKAAADWALRQMESWGLQNAHLEEWEFGHPGWMNRRLSAHIVAPVEDALVCEALGWTPGTSGTVSASALQLPLPERPSAEELEKHLSDYAGKVGGRIVLAGAPRKVAVSLNPAPRRRDDEQLRKMYDPENPAPQSPRGPRPKEPADPTRLAVNAINQKVDAFLVANGAALRINDAGMENSQVRAFQNRTYDISKAVPTVVMRNEDYGRIWRLLDDGLTVDLEFNIVNRMFPEGTTSYNALAEIPGTDLKDEIVLMGGHIDSWHSATGATDNAVGCAMMMEAARILSALGVRPRRTIRVALWGGEEQGLLGSQAYVKQHYGTAEEPKPEFSELSAYLNIDSGTGRPRGLSVFGPAEAAQILRETAAPLQDLGVVGVMATKSRTSGGTDSASFSNAGLPGVGISQDPIEYFNYTWHTNSDTYERILEDDVKTGAQVIASVAYHLAMRDGLLPRFPKEEMPAPAKRPE